MNFFIESNEEMDIQLLNDELNELEYGDEYKEEVKEE